MHRFPSQLSAFATREFASAWSAYLAVVFRRGGFLRPICANPCNPWSNSLPWPPLTTYTDFLSGIMSGIALRKSDDGSSVRRRMREKLPSHPLFLKILSPCNPRNPPKHNIFSPFHVPMTPMVNMNMNEMPSHFPEATPKAIQELFNQLPINPSSKTAQVILNNPRCSSLFLAFPRCSSIILDNPR